MTHGTIDEAQKMSVRGRWPGLSGLVLQCCSRHVSERRPVCILGTRCVLVDDDQCGDWTRQFWGSTPLVDGGGIRAGTREAETDLAI